MEQTTTYMGVSKVRYKFTQGDILDALCKLYKITLPIGKYEFDIYEEYEDQRAYAELVIRYEQPAKE